LLHFLQKQRTKGGNTQEIANTPTIQAVVMYPSFVEEIVRDNNGGRALIICGREYMAHALDTHIDDAIELASRWQQHQVTYERIVHLRTWIRENHQPGHDLPYKHLRNMKSCKHFVEMVIHSEFTLSGSLFTQGYKSCLKENNRIFSKLKGKG
jgi:hypothetical protein